MIEITKYRVYDQDGGYIEFPSLDFGDMPYETIIEMVDNEATGL